MCFERVEHIASPSACTQSICIQNFRWEQLDGSSLLPRLSTRMYCQQQKAGGGLGTRLGEPLVSSRVARPARLLLVTHYSNRHTPIDITGWGFRDPGVSSCLIFVYAQFCFW